MLCALILRSVVLAAVWSSDLHLHRHVFLQVWPYMRDVKATCVQYVTFGIEHHRVRPVPCFLVPLSKSATSQSHIILTK